MLKRIYTFIMQETTTDIDMKNTGNTIGSYFNEENIMRPIQLRLQFAIFIRRQVITMYQGQSHF